MSDKIRMSSKFLNRQLVYEMLPPGSLGSHLEISLLCLAAPLLRLQNPFLLKSQISLPWTGSGCSVHWQGWSSAVRKLGKLLHLRIIIVSPGRDCRCVTEQRNFLCKDWSTKDNIKAKVGQGPISEVRKVRITHKGPKLNKSYHFILVSLCFCICILIGPRSNPATSLNRI